VTWLHLFEYCPMSGWVVYQRWQKWILIYHKSTTNPEVEEHRIIGYVQLWCLTPKTYYIAVRISLLSRIYKLSCTLFHMYFRLLAAIFDFSLTTTNGSVWISPVVLLDIKNIDIAVGISLPSYIQAEIYVIPYPLPGTSLIYNSRWRGRVFVLALRCFCNTSKMTVSLVSSLISHSYREILYVTSGQ